MGSWYVENLIRNGYRIRLNIIHKNYAPSVDMCSVSFEFSDNDYNNLLSIETVVNDLIKNNSLTKKEYDIIVNVMGGKSLNVISKEFGISRVTVSKIFSGVCERISYILGDEFTDEGYLEYIKDKYKLTEEQINKAKEFLEDKSKRLK